MSNSLQPHGLYSSWNSPGQNTGVGSFSLLQRIFTTQGSNPGFLHCRQTLYQLNHQRSLFKLWCWRKLLRIPWTARRSKQSILKEINPEYSLDGLMLKLKLQYLGHLMWRADSLEKTQMLERLRARGEEGDRGWDGWMASLTQWTWVLSKLWEIVKDREA